MPEFVARIQPTYLQFGDINLHVTSCESLGIERGDEVTIESNQRSQEKEVRPVRGGDEMDMEHSVLIPPELLDELGAEEGDTVTVFRRKE
ncbi:MAG: hypothetical protein ABEI97_03490 [Candidatus Nanohaloarchaea archaeon]